VEISRGEPGASRRFNGNSYLHRLKAIAGFAEDLGDACRRIRHNRSTRDIHSLTRTDANRRLTKGSGTQRDSGLRKVDEDRHRSRVDAMRRIDRDNVSARRRFTTDARLCGVAGMHALRISGCELRGEDRATRRQQTDNRTGWVDALALLVKTCRDDSVEGRAQHRRFEFLPRSGKLRFGLHDAGSRNGEIGSPWCPLRRLLLLENAQCRRGRGDIGLRRIDIRLGRDAEAQELLLAPEFRLRNGKLCVGSGDLRVCLCELLRPRTTGYFREARLSGRKSGFRLKHLGFEGTRIEAREGRPRRHVFPNRDADRRDASGLRKREGRLSIGAAADRTETRRAGTPVGTTMKRNTASSQASSRANGGSTITAKTASFMDRRWLNRGGIR